MNEDEECLRRLFKEEMDSNSQLGRLLKSSLERNILRFYLDENNKLVCLIQETTMMGCADTP